MSIMMMILLSLIAFVAFAVFWGIGIYNTFVRLKALLKEAWSGIDVQLKRRYDLIPNLVETVKGYQIHEKTTLENIAKYRSAAMHATGVEEKAMAEAGLTQTLKTLFAVAENYPELKANENFLRLQKQLSKIEDEIQLARRYYNGTVRNYNVKVQTFPSNIVAAFAGFHEAPFFELSLAAEREVPTVKF